jgi:hypothetical protein
MSGFVGVLKALNAKMYHSCICAMLITGAKVD